MSFLTLALSAVALASTPTTPDTPSQVAYTVKEPTQTPQGTINFSGGNVMANGVNVYAIFYGNHAPTTPSLIQSFVEGLGTSDWWSTSLTYSGDNGVINSDVKWKTAIYDNYSLGKTLKSGSVVKIIESAVRAGKLPKDSNGIYTVFTSADVSESSFTGSFCDGYCGYHSVTSSLGLKYAFQGDGTRCPGTLPPPGAEKGTPGCLQRYWRNQTAVTYSVNKNQAADSMINVLAHELTETASDFDNAWRDDSGLENADKCAAYYIGVQNARPSDYAGAYNAVVGNGKYLLQANWHATKQGCVNSIRETPLIPATAPLERRSSIRAGKAASKGENKIKIMPMF